MDVCCEIFLFSGNPAAVEFACPAELAGTMVHIRIYQDSREGRTSGKSVSDSAPLLRANIPAKDHL